MFSSYLCINIEHSKEYTTIVAASKERINKAGMLAVSFELDLKNESHGFDFDFCQNK